METKMQTRLLSLFTRTPLHVGAGSSVGVVDLPVQRERHTRIPIIPGSSLKGVLRDLWPSAADEASWLFGRDTTDGAAAGALLIGEARVLAFPVRSARGAFAWLTCPLVLHRFLRDSGRSFKVPEVTGEMCQAAPELILKAKVVFEDYCLDATELAPAALADYLKDLCADPVWTDLPHKLAVVSDEVFCHFAEHACEVVTRVCINDDTGTVKDGALFNQENVPSETLLYTLLAAQPEKRPAKDKDGKPIKHENGAREATTALTALAEKLKDGDNLLQLGGDETTGLGWCTTKIIEVEARKGN